MTLTNNTIWSNRYEVAWYEEALLDVYAKCKGLDSNPWKFDSRLFPHMPGFTADKLSEMLTSGEERIVLIPLYNTEYYPSFSIQAISHSRDYFQVQSYDCHPEPFFLNYSRKLHTEREKEWAKKATEYTLRTGLADQFLPFRGYKVAWIELDGVTRSCVWVVWAAAEHPKTVQEWDYASIYATADPLEGQELSSFLMQPCSDPWKGVCTNCNGITRVRSGQCTQCREMIRLDLDKIRSTSLPERLKTAVINWYSRHSNMLGYIMSKPDKI